MNLEEYRFEPTAFDKFSEIFIQNSIKRNLYSITLDDGKTYSGIPACTFFELQNENKAKFHFWMGSDLYRIPFASLKECNPIKEVNS